jgi:hypothetical protein
MASGHESCNVKIVLANPEPSTHGTIPLIPAQAGIQMKA